MVTEQHYIISHRRPHQWLMAMVAAVLLSIAIQWYINRMLNTEQQEQLSGLQQQNEQLQTEILKHQQLNQDLTTRLKDQQHMLAMHAVTDQQLQNDLKTLQNQVMELNKELLFYQNITQGTASSELQIRELQIRPIDEAEKRFHYRIVITQGKKISKSIKGDIDVYLETANNEQRLINQHDLKLRHVQVLEGSIQLNENETPTGLFIQLKQDKKTLTKRTFDWEIKRSE